MQFPHSWLTTQANPNLSPDQLAHLLTMAGLEVEETAPAAPAFSGVVVAEVKSVEKHPDADRLNVTQVDAGTGELLQIVCGAPNVRVGVKVPCALAGAVLPENFKIKDKQPMLAHQNPTTGQVSISSYLPEWQEFLDAWQQLDGTEWELPRYEYAIERPDLFAD